MTIDLRARLLTATLTVLSGTAVVAATLLAAPVAQAGDSEAIDAFKQRHEAVTKLVKSDASDKKLQAKVDQLLDYDWLAKAALGGPDRFASVCGDRCDEFESLLTALIRENYLRMIRKSEKHPVEYVGQVAGRDDIYKVTTRIQIDKNGRQQVVTVEYIMHKVDGVWQVRDIITDDVSLAKTYSYEFNKISKSGGIDAIIAKLEERLAKLAANG